jgi:hypothetical protein
MKKIHEQLLFDDIPVTEVYPVEKKYVIHAVIFPANWEGESFKSSAIRIDHCCEDSTTFCTELCPQRSNAPSGGRDPINFLKLLYRGQPVEKCPFCGAGVELVVHGEPDEKQWY